MLCRNLANTAHHPAFADNPFYWSDEHPVSTFSADVDTASYTYLRKSVLGQSTLPQADAVRIEELINYFDYDYPSPAADTATPFATNIEIADCPWDATHRLARLV